MPSLTEEYLLPFVEHIRRSSSKHVVLKRYLGDVESIPPANVLHWIHKAREAGDNDEVLWRCLLAGHLGYGGYESASQLLCGFGNSPTWTWLRISSELPVFGEWLVAYQHELSRLNFGNHKKYESKKPKALLDVIGSFVGWIMASGRSPGEAFNVDERGDPTAKFDRLYRRLRTVRRFGRTGVFDMLCLLGNLEIIRIEPGSCYLQGSTGPLAGARRLWGKLPRKKLSLVADETARTLGLRMDVFEDALCNWQK
jgi:hypothetical protein